MDVGTGALIGGLALSACWGGLWFVIGTIGLVRGVCSLRVVLNSVVVVVSPVVLGWGIWWMRGNELSSDMAFVGGLLIMPLVVITLALRRTSDGRRVGHHMAEGVRRLKDELLGAHHACAGCGHDHADDRAGGHA